MHDGGSLVESLQFHSNCPVCRKPFKRVFGPPAVNKMLSAVLERSFPERYISRQMDYLADTESDAGGGSSDS